MSRTVSYEEWLQHGIYPAGSPGKDAGKPFNPSDPNLRSYYDNDVSTWNSAEPALRIAINNQHGFGFANSGGEGEGGEGGGGGGGGGSGGSGSSGLGPVFTPLDLSAPNQNDYWSYYPQSYIPADPAYPTMGLLSQPYSGSVDLYQPWSQQYGDALVADNLWNYSPPSLPGPAARWIVVSSGGGEDHSGGGSPPAPTVKPAMTPEEMKAAGLLDGTGGAVGGAATGYGPAGPEGVDSGEDPGPAPGDFGWGGGWFD